MNRTDFQALAALRIREAETLLAAGLWDGAYYLAGYAVECALKACVCKTIVQNEFPPKVEIVRDLYTHEFPKLLKHSGVQSAFVDECVARPSLDANWLLVAGWKVEDARYKCGVTEAIARGLITAITDPNEGVLTWIMDRW